MKKTNDYDEENGDLNHRVRYTCVNVLNFDDDNGLYGRMCLMNFLMVYGISD
jgi:hypothetical protein